MAYQFHVGKCEDELKSLPDNSVDSIVTDPPYGLSFQGKKWDYDVPTVEQWAECLRVLKPGGFLLAFGGSRTYHRLVVNVEDAGFEVRDQILWVYGSGFPKSKNLDGDWDGWGTALKPAHEPIVLARKPLSETVASNMTTYGTGALNIDACRIAYDPDDTNPATNPLYRKQAGYANNNSADSGSTSFSLKDGSGERNPNELGRWPANIIHDGSDDVIACFPAEAGAKAPVTGNEPSAASTGKVMNMRKRVATAHHGDKGSAARFFYCAKVRPTERDEGLERFISVSASDMTNGRKEGSVGINDPRAGAGRTKGAKNNHPTIKPIALMKYLCRLVTQPGGTVLDPWMGSGSTGRAAIEEGFSFIGIDTDPDYVTIASARVAFSMKKRSLDNGE